MEIDTRSRLGGILRRGEVEVNSLHHQAIARVGRGFLVSAQAPDGVIEAIESENGLFQLGVQWHPEKMSGAAGRELFHALVLACKHG